MTAPVWTAKTIAQLAFARFLVSAADEQATVHSAAAIADLEPLCHMIGNQFCQHPKATAAIASIHAGEEAGLNRLMVYLQDAMEDDSAFAIRIQELAHNIATTRLITEQQMQQTICNDGKGYQTSVEHGKAYIGDDLYITDNSRIGSQAATVQGNVYNFFGSSYPPPHCLEPSTSNGATPTPPHNIPHRTPTFVDRKPDVEKLHQQLQHHP
ncbi:MAG: hypothetical protein HC866_25130 [Leptolyngbyaceae cyanobacterium RU_5_1]|nr:hypothetical protein [Leptolyngbyaceae cyanobacterium RU_5_1]